MTHATDRLPPGQRKRKAPGAQGALAAAVLLFMALPAHADDRDACDKATGDEAIAACTRLIELGGATSKAELAEVYGNRAAAKGRKGDLDGALADFSRAIALDRSNPRACFSRGLTNMKKGDADGAIADFDCAIEATPGRADRYIYRGLAKGLKADFDGVIADMNRAIELDGNNSAAFLFRGMAKLEKKDRSGSLADLDRAIALNPRNAPAYVFRAGVKGKIGNYDGAIADASRATEIDPGMARAYLVRGNAKRLSGDFDGAMADFNRATELDPQRGYSSRGEARLDQGDVDGAIADYSRSLGAEPGGDGAYFERGVAYFIKGDYAASAADLVRAQQKRDDGYVAMWLYLARAHGKADAKAELAAKAAKLDRKWPAPLIQLYLGHGTPESVRAAAQNPDPMTQADQVCEANFYLAERLLLGNDTKGAKPLLEDAASHCPKYNLESTAARLELRRLGSKP